MVFLDYKYNSEEKIEHFLTILGLVLYSDK